MQNRYTGDIGDYGKLGLLRAIAAVGLSIGINWYLTPNESHNGDGRHVSYLYDERYRACDEPLWLELRRIVDSDKRQIAELQCSQIIEALFYSAPLVFSGKAKQERVRIREKWHENALSKLAGTDVVFVDPDNGLIVPSAVARPKENKYVKPIELSDYYMQGSSVIYYQHKARKLDSHYIDQHNRLIREPGFEGSTGLALKFSSVSQRYYFFIVQPHHKALIETAVCRLRNSAWSEHFRALSL